MHTFPYWFQNKWMQVKKGAHVIVYKDWANEVVYFSDVKFRMEYM